MNFKDIPVTNIQADSMKDIINDMVNKADSCTNVHKTIMTQAQTPKVTRELQALQEIAGGSVDGKWWREEPIESEYTWTGFLHIHGADAAGC